MSEPSFEKWPDGLYTTIGEREAFEMGMDAAIARIEEGAVERVMDMLDELNSVYQLATERNVAAFSSRIVAAVLKGGRV